MPIILILDLVAMIVIVYAMSYLRKEIQRRLHNNFLFMVPDSTMVNWHWRGASTEKVTPGMRKIMLRSGTGEPFKALVGFFVDKAMIDNFGFVASGPNGVVVFETFLGQGPCTFTFLINKYIYVEVSTDEQRTGMYRTSYSFPPHWWQRLGIFG